MDVLLTVPIFNSERELELKKQQLFLTTPTDKPEAHTFRDYHDSHTDFMQCITKPIPLLKRSSSYYTKQVHLNGSKWNAEYQQLMSQYQKDLSKGNPIT